MVRRMRKPRSSGDDLTVGIMHWAFPPTIGGVESHLADYIRLLHGRGVRVVALTGPPAGREIRRHAVVERHSLLELSDGRTPPEDRPEHIEELSEWLGNRVAKYGINVIHGHNLHHFSSVPAKAVNIVAGSFGIARQHTFHNYWDVVDKAALVADWEGRWANSSYVAQRCAENYMGESPQPRYMGIDPDRFTSRREPFSGRDHRSRNPKNAPVILQPARLLRWKGPEHSVRMLSELHRAGYYARLVLTDTPSLIDWDDEREQLREDLKQLIEDLHLTGWVEFSSKAHYRDMPQLYNDADIVINPSHREPWGLVPLEAMAASRPVVATQSGGVKESITRRTGTLVTGNRNIVEHLAKAVRAFLDRPDKAVQAGRIGRERVVKKFHMDVYVRSMVEEYKTALAAMPVRDVRQPEPTYGPVIVKKPESVPVGV
jgi:glycosyltransferase involved in cell wall biosynthesis